MTRKFDEERLTFSIFNLGNADTTKLDYLGVKCTGDCDDFKLTLAALNDLGVGSHFDGFIDEFYQDIVGNYAATYEFLFSDDTSVGASATRKQSSLFLNVHGSVVPEPGTIALVLAGLGVIGIGTRRRKQQAVN